MSVLSIGENLTLETRPSDGGSIMVGCMSYEGRKWDPKEPDTDVS